MPVHRTLSYSVGTSGSEVSDTHILPISKIVQSVSNNGLISCSRDGTIICGNDGDLTKIQCHSDWVTDVVEIGLNQFISVGYDFNVIYHNLDGPNGARNSKIVGTHDDYINCVVLVSGSTGLFATGGLDRKVKVWNMVEDQIELKHVFENAQRHDTGSIYALAARGNTVDRFTEAEDGSSDFCCDLVAGDNNGDIILYSCAAKQEVGRIHRAHKSNIKCLKVIDDGDKLFSASADGTICIWRFEDSGTKLVKVGMWDWKLPVWCVWGSYSEYLLIGDANGKISVLQLDSDGKATMQVIADTAQHIKKSNAKLENATSEGKKPSTKPFGILDLVHSDYDNSIYFSVSCNSNLYQLKLGTRKLNIIRNGSDIAALTRSSLLTNRRHVITENTKGDIQRWDIISCELLDTFAPEEGTFEELVSKYTSKEILSHWCTVSVKMGLLFVKLDEKFMNTEIYGTALTNYYIYNNVPLNNDERYNLGKILVHSLLHNLVEFELRKDKIIRKKITSTNDNSVGDVQQAKPKDKRRKSLFKFSMNDDSVLEEDIISPGSDVNAWNNAVQNTVADDDNRLSSAGSAFTKKLRLFSNSNSNSNTPETSFNETVIEEEDQMMLAAPTSHETMSDWLQEVEYAYKQQYMSLHSSASIKLLTKKHLDSKLIVDSKLPLVRINNGVLIVVHEWDTSACGGRVLYSTYIPLSTIDPYASDTISPDYDIDIELFENLEQHLPYWFAKSLLNDVKKVNTDQPKLNFTIVPWRDENEVVEKPQAPPSKPYHMLKFERNKSTDIILSTTDLPKISEGNTKLTAPAMIKTKKIKQYISERFESKTPEMRSKLEPSDWLELLCRNQVLENDMTLGTIRTLYWKSQGEMILEYRRRMHN